MGGTKQPQLFDGSLGSSGEDTHEANVNYQQTPGSFTSSQSFGCQSFCDPFGGKQQVLTFLGLRPLGNHPLLASFQIQPQYVALYKMIQMIIYIYNDIYIYIHIYIYICIFFFLEGGEASLVYSQILPLRPIQRPALCLRARLHRAAAGEHLLGAGSSKESEVSPGKRRGN